MRLSYGYIPWGEFLLWRNQLASRVCSDHTSTANGDKWCSGGFVQSPEYATIIPLQGTGRHYALEASVSLQSILWSYRCRVWGEFMLRRSGYTPEDSLTTRLQNMRGVYLYRRVIIPHEIQRPKGWRVCVELDGPGWFVPPFPIFCDYVQKALTKSSYWGYCLSNYRNIYGLLRWLPKMDKKLHFMYFFMWKPCSRAHVRSWSIRISSRRHSS